MSAAEKIRARQKKCSGFSRNDLDRWRRSGSGRNVAYRIRQEDVRIRWKCSGFSRNDLDQVEKVRIRQKCCIPDSARRCPDPVEMFRIQQKRSNSGGKCPDPAEMSRTGCGKKMSGSGGNVSDPAGDPPYSLIYSVDTRQPRVTRISV